MALRSSVATAYYGRTASLPSVTSLSACGWARQRATQSGGFRCFFNLERTSATTGWIELAFTGNLVYQDKDGTNVSLFTQPAVDAWFWWGVTNAGTGASNAKLYGFRPGTDTVIQVVSSSGQATFTSQRLDLLRDADSAQFFNGAVAAVKIWSGAVLTQAEMEREIWSYRPQRLSNLYSWSPLIEESTVDMAGTAHPWTKNGSPVLEDNPPIIW